MGAGIFVGYEDIFFDTKLSVVPSALKLSGSPSFGGTYTEDGETYPLALETKTVTKTSMVNGVRTETAYTLYRRYYSKKNENGITTQYYPDNVGVNSRYYMLEDGKLCLVDQYGNHMNEVDCNFIPGIGNLRNDTLTDKTNGGKLCVQTRDDIYIAGYARNNGTAVNAQSLKVTGPLSGKSGSIWVYAEQDPHYLQNEQFAVFAADNMTDNEKTNAVEVFRNACDDTTSKNTKGDYLYGVTESDGVNINWSGIKGNARAILRKVNSSSDPLAGANFELYQGQSSTRIPWPGLLEGTNPVYEVTSMESGVFYIGDLPYGEYYLKETDPPGDYEGNRGKWFCLLVDETGVWMSKEGYKDESGGKNTAKNDATGVKNAALAGT